MRAVLLLLSLAVLTGCSLIRVVDAEDLECVGPWPAGAPPPGPNLLSPTIEERVAGTVGVARVRLDSISHDLPDRALNNRGDLGYVTLEFAVVDHLKGGHQVPETVMTTIEVGYDCEYNENDHRDREALAKMSADIREFLDDRILVMFLPDYRGFRMSGRVTFHQEPVGNQGTQVGNGFWIGYNNDSDWTLGTEDGSRWLLRAEGMGSDQDPHFVDPLDAVYTVYVPENTISLSELRERVNAVITEEEERGVECVGAHYLYQWYVRSNEESWYRGRVGSDGTPIECI